MIGTTVRHYRIDAELGRGGMGAVFLAYDTKLHRHVALKVLPSEHSGDSLQRFEREARAVAALSHPNVVTIYSVEECDGVHFLTMEAVDGMPPTDVIGHRRMTIGEILAIAIPLADAVAAAHAHGIIHLHLKPGNVMLGSNGTVTRETSSQSTHGRRLERAWPVRPGSRWASSSIRFAVEHTTGSTRSANGRYFCLTGVTSCSCRRVSTSPSWTQ